MASIKQQILSGTFYTAVARYSGILISLGVTAILARLLSPDEFGIVAVAMVIINFFNIFTDIGFSAAIIQNKELTSDDLSNIYSFTVWLGIFLGGLFFLSSGSIAKYYQNDQLITLCRLLSVNLFFSSATLVPNTLFYKEKEFKFIAFRSFFIQTVTGLLAIGAALAGAGLHTLVIQPILSNLLVYWISLRKHPQKLRFTFGIKSIRKIWSYSLYQFLFNMVTYFSSNLDKLLIGKHMGINMLGYYEKSYRLIQLPLQNITFVITPVMHPFLSDYQNDLKRLGHIHEHFVRLLAFIGIPLSTLLFLCADELILFFFGPQWTSSIPVFKILSLTVGIQIILSSSGSFYQAGNSTRGMFICGLFTSFTGVIGILTGIFYFHSLEATAWCICIAVSLNFIQCYLQLYRYTLRRRMIRFYRCLLSPLLAGVLSGAAVYSLSLLIPDWNLFFSLAAKTFCCAITTCAYMQCTKEYDFIAKVRTICRLYPHTGPNR